MILDSVKGLFRVLDAAAEVSGFTSVAALESALGQAPLPDLVLIDFNMPGLASVEAVAAFIDRHHDVRIAVISGQVDGQLARDLIRNGCLGFVPKSLAPNALFHAIRLMVGGTRFLPDLLLNPVWPDSSAASDAVPAAASADRHRLGLTPREIEVLRTLASGQTNKQIARELNIEEVTVKLHLRRSYAKLGVRNRIGAVRAILGGVLD
ncbi:MAG: response regulator transcription factor [Rhodospirillaceae bacterium]